VSGRTLISTLRSYNVHQQAFAMRHRSSSRRAYDSGTGTGVGEIKSLDTYFDRAAS